MTYGVYTYSNSDATSRPLKGTGNILKRMSDTELENIAMKLQEYFANTLAQSNYSNFTTFGNSYYTATYGSVFASDFDRSYYDKNLRGYKFSDTYYPAKQTTKSNNAFDIFADDDDTFSDPPTLVETTWDDYYLYQKDFADYGRNSEATATLQSGGDYYNEIRNGASESNYNSQSHYIFGQYHPAEWVRDFLYSCTDSSGTPKTQGDFGKIAEAIFKMVNARIRTNDSRNYGSYRIATSSPGNGWHLVTRSGMTVNDGTSTLFNAFQDRVSSVVAPYQMNYRDSYLTNGNLRNTYYLYLKVPDASSGATNPYDTGGIAGNSGAKPVHIEKWKITVHSGSGVDVDNSGQELAFWGVDNTNINNVGKYFYFKPENVNGTLIKVSSDITSANPSSSSFESTQRTMPSFSSNMTSVVTPDASSTAKIYPNGSNGGWMSIWANQRYAGSFNTNTVYKCERVTTIKEHDLPDIGAFNNFYNTNGSYYGSASPTYANREGERNDLRTMALIRTLYMLYTYGMYYPRYELKDLGWNFSGSVTSSGEFSHGYMQNTTRSVIGVQTPFPVAGPTLFNSTSAETGTYYKIRYAGSTSYQTRSAHLISTSHV